jgi:hypothetical protein
MKPIGDYLPKDALTLKKSKKTQRGELMRFFQRHLNYSRAHDNMPMITMSRMGKILEGIPTDDLYYLKSVCSRAKHFSKKFWWEVDPSKHEEKSDSQPF